MTSNQLTGRSTTDVLRLLQRENPNAQLTEGKIRFVIRKGILRPSLTLGGAYVWNDAEINALAKALGVPSPEMGQ